MKPSNPQINTYTIQQWLFDEAQGAFDIDLGESGIQYHCLGDLRADPAFDLNYSQDRGNENLRTMIAQMYGAGADQVIVTHGSQEALYLFYRCHLGPGDHVLTFTPGWQQSWEVPAHLGADVTKLPLARESDYTIDWQGVADAVRDNTRLLILCYPNNPLGVTLSRDDWEQLERLRETTGIHVLIDEEYLTDYQASVFCRLPGSYAVSSLSKIYGFPGLRLGWFVGDQRVVNRMVNLKRYTTVCNSSICEYFALQVLGNRLHYVERYERLRGDGLDVLRPWVEAQPQLALIEPQGTPFAYLKYHGPGTSADFCLRLLQQKRVLLMPAEVFEDQQAVRLSFGRPREMLLEGLDRINSFLEADR